MNRILGLLALALAVGTPQAGWSSTTVQELMEPMIEKRYECPDGFLRQVDPMSGESLPLWDMPEDGRIVTKASHIKPHPDAVRVDCSTDPAWVPDEFTQEDAAEVFRQDPDWKQDD